MKVRALTNIKSSRGIIPTGQVVNIPLAAFDRLQGKVSPLPTSENWREHTADIRERDPCGDCWGWVKQNRPDLWREHLRSLHGDDLSTARLTFNRMLEAWEHRHELTQGTLI